MCSSALKKSAVLVEKALFVSGRDASSTRAFSDLLRKSKNPAVQPDDVAFVRDPVLSYKALSDKEGKCWKQSEGTTYSFVMERKDRNRQRGAPRELCRPRPHKLPIRRLVTTFTIPPFRNSLGRRQGVLGEVQNCWRPKSGPRGKKAELVVLSEFGSRLITYRIRSACLKSRGFQENI